MDKILEVHVSKRMEEDRLTLLSNKLQITFSSTPINPSMSYKILRIQTNLKERKYN